MIRNIRSNIGKLCYFVSSHDGNGLFHASILYRIYVYEYVVNAKMKGEVNGVFNEMKRTVVTLRFVQSRHFSMVGKKLIGLPLLH